MLFQVSVLPCIWVIGFLDYGNLADVYLVLIGAGTLSMAVIGFLLDRLSVSRRIWIPAYISLFLTILLGMLSQFPSVERAIAKNGSLLAYVCAASNMGLYLSALLFLAVGTLAWLWRVGGGMSGNPGP